MIFRLAKPQRDGRTALSRASLELIGDLAALLPLLRLRRHRYYGVLAPNAPLRTGAIAYTS